MILGTRTDIGLYRNKNEDFVCVAKHPDDENIVLLALADGMGGKEHGEVASKTMVTSIYKFFMKSKLDNFNDLKNLYGKIDAIIHKVNDLIISKYGENTVGTTLCVTIINHDKAININCGDSRCYIFTDKEFIQVNEDDSEVYRLYKGGNVQKNDLKYFTYNNLITRCIGLNNDLCRSRCYVIDKEFDGIVLFSDGVTDVLDEEEIFSIIKSNDKEKILDAIIDKAVYGEKEFVIPEYLKSKYKYLFTPFSGKDNTSGVIYIK